MDDSGAATTRRVSIFSYVMLSLFVLSALLFLVFTFVRQGQDFNLTRTYVDGVPYQANATGVVAAEGRVMVHRTEPFIDWDILHSGLGHIVSLDIFGPVRPDDPLSGPVKLVLCRAGSTFPCLFSGANRLHQRIYTTPALRTLLVDVPHILDDLHLYKLRINTTAHPDGALFFRFR